MDSSSPKIIFLGTPEFATPALNALVKNNLKPILVITQPNKPAGRNKKLAPPPIKQVALENNIPLTQPANKKELKKVFENNKADVCVLVAYGMIIPEEILDKPKFGFLNLHPSLLPKYRGSSPLQSALLSGDEQTGITIMKLNDKMDEGPIVAQKEIKIKSDDNAETLHDELSKIGAELLIRILPDYLSGKIKLTPQNDNQATYTKMIKREDGKINWQKSALEVERQFRAFYPWPGIFTNLGKKRLKIVKIGVLKGDFKPDLSPGEVFLGPNQELAVKCKEGAVKLISVQLEGKKEMSGIVFLRGQRDLLGRKL